MSFLKWFESPEKKWANAYRERLLYYVTIPGVNYFNIPRDQIINDPRSIIAAKGFTDFAFLSDYGIGKSCYYPIDTNETDIYLLPYDLTSKLSDYKKHCIEQLCHGIPKSELINSIKVQFMQSYLAKHASDSAGTSSSQSWESTRRMIIDRDNHECVLCGHKLDYSFHVHHVIYRAHGGSNEPKNLVLLCGQCHESLPQHRLLSDSFESVDFGCYVKNLHRIISHILSSHQNIISRMIFDKVLSKNPLLNIVEKSHFNISKDIYFTVLARGRVGVLSIDSRWNK
jgi:hypothetical protein